MRHETLIGVVALAIALAGCGGGGSDTGGAASLPPTGVSPPPPPPPATVVSTEREIDPVRTSAGITRNFSPHIAINPGPQVQAKGKLFVFLPGTGGVPRNQRMILRTAAERGYHAVGLSYPNDDAVTTTCQGSAVADCTGLMRREVITGEDTSPLANVDRANSITSRLIALIRYLSTTYPAEQWNQFLINDQPNWALLTIAGHSQGAGHAGYFAKLHSLDRTVMFAAPGDSGLGAPAPWLSLPNLTPASRQYGFMHTGDQSAPFPVVTINWAVLGLGQFGPVTSVDGAAAPYGGSHQLSTSLGAAAGVEPGREHGAVVVDGALPLDAAGVPIYKPVWIYLAFP